MGKRGNRPTVEKTSSRGSSSRSSSSTNLRQGNSKDSAALNLRQRKRYCYFCKENVNYIDYKNVAVLKKFVSDKGKIRPKRSTGNCVQHQKMIADAIKRSREVALMAYFRR